MNPKQKKILTVITPILISGVLVWYSLQKVPLSQIIEEAKNAKIFWVIISVICLILSHISRAYRWTFMLEPLGYKVKFQNSLMAVFSAYLINYGIPRSGEVARATILTNYENIPFQKGFGTIVAERVVDSVMMLIVVFVTLTLQFEFILSFVKDKFNLNMLIVLAISVLLFAILFIVLKKNNSNFFKKIRAFILGLYEGIVSVFKMKKKWPFIFHTIFIWSLYLLMFYSTTLAFNSLKSIPLNAILIGFISGSFSIAATNGGTGGYPVAVAEAFSLFGVAYDPSYAFGWVLWGAQTLMTIILGGLSLIYLPIYNQRKNPS